MIVDIDTIKDEFPNIDEKKLIKKLKAIEKTIRSHTNNNFMNRKYRTYGQIKDGILYMNDYLYFSEKENIEISHTLNDDVYTIKSINQKEITFLEEPRLFDCQKVMITKVEYPEDVQEGAINMLKWDLGLRNKIGIKSETISRHSITYFDMDANNSVKGYPASLLGFLDDYMNARF